MSRWCMRWIIGFWIESWEGSFCCDGDENLGLLGPPWVVGEGDEAPRGQTQFMWGVRNRVLFLCVLKGISRS